MKHRLLQNLPCIFLFFFFPVIIHSKNTCFSYCSFNSFELSVRYPFKLDTDHTPTRYHDYITLRCSYQGQTMLHLPSYGDFIVDDFKYYSRRITLTDPNGCLPRRLMNNLSFFPFKALYTNYTFYTCNRKPIERAQIPIIECMSNSTNVTIAIANSYAELFLKYYDCETLVHWLLPVPSITGTLRISDVLELTWNVTDCEEDCFNYGIGRSGDNDSSKSRWKKFISSPLIIPSVVVLASFFALSCYLRLLKLVTGRRDTEAGDNLNGTNSESTTTRATPASPNEANSGVGQSSTRNRPCIETIVVGEIHSISLPNAQTSCCSICLEDYQEKDTVRYLSQCGHYFHAQCVNKWLHKNTTCPVCRDKLSASNL